MGEREVANGEEKTTIYKCNKTIWIKCYNTPDVAIISKLNFIIIAEYTHIEYICKECSLGRNRIEWVIQINLSPRLLERKAPQSSSAHSSWLFPVHLPFPSRHKGAWARRCHSTVKGCPIAAMSAGTNKSRES